MEKYYLIYIWGCVEPELRGPFDSDVECTNVAKEMFKNEVSDEDVLFGLTIEHGGVASIWSFSQDFVDEALEDDD